MDDFKPQVGQSTTMSVRSQGGQATMPKKLETILREGHFETLGEYVGRLEREGQLNQRSATALAVR